MPECSLTIGDVSLPLRFRDRSILEAVEERWGTFLSPGGSTWVIEVSASKTLNAPAGNPSLFQLCPDGQAFRFASPFFQGVWNGFGKPCSLVVTSDSRYLTCALENALRFLFSVAGLMQGKVLLHAAAVLHGRMEKAILFFGDSGTGKTSVASLSLDLGHACLGDDLVMIGLEGHRAMVYSTPFWGDLEGPERRPMARPVACLLSLCPSSENSITSLEGAAAVSHIVTGVPFMGGRGREAYGRLMDVVGRICRRIPVGLLHFRLEPDFMKEVEAFLTRQVSPPSALSVGPEAP